MAKIKSRKTKYYRTCSWYKEWKLFKFFWTWVNKRILWTGAETEPLQTFDIPAAQLLTAEEQLNMSELILNERNACPSQRC